MTTFVFTETEETDEECRHTACAAFPWVVPCLCLQAQIVMDSISADELNILLIEQIERLAEDGEEDIDSEELLEGESDRG